MRSGPIPTEGTDLDRVSDGNALTIDAIGGTVSPRSGDAGRKPEPGRLERGTTVGRHVVLDELGAGGMGVVYVAYDPELDRKVALKLLSGSAGPSARVRLLREAQALAKLNHPNVVTIHDVGEVDDKVWLAMEFVQGQTLGRWQKTPRHWREVVGVLGKAGEGLAAAHAAELLHRDFKPDNVMVGDDGRVRVMDFGLARAAPKATTDSHGERNEAPTPEGSSLHLTKAGAIVGTPAYMAPEQFALEELTAATDQFSFCVTLWEALYGVRPFGGSTTAELANNVLEGQRRGPPSGRGVPSWLRRVCERGLAVEPMDRWPSMRALLDALGQDPAGRRRVWLSGLAGVVVVAAVGTSWHSWTTDRAERCSGAEARLSGGWDAARRAEVEAAMLGIGASYASRAWERTASELDRYAAEWASMYTEACEATTVRGEQSSEVMDLRMACLHRARVELGAAVELLADADAQVVQRAHEVTGGLRSLSQCSDVEALVAGDEPPAPEDAAAVDRVRQRLEEARVAEEAGRYPQARRKVEEAKAELGEVSYGPVRVELALAEGSMLLGLGEYEASEARLREALELASESRQWEAMASAAMALMTVVGDRQQRTAEALRYRELALGLAKGDPRLHAGVRHGLASILHRRGEYEHAEAESRLALELRERAFGPQHPSVATSRNNLGNILGEQGKVEEAEAEHRRALALWQEALGPEHPDVAKALGNLAADLQSQGKLKEAEAELRRALELQERAFGPEHPDVAGSRDALANNMGMQGRLAEAEQEHRRALALREQAFGPEHPVVAKSRYNLAIDLMLQGKLPEAEPELLEVLEQQERVLGSEHPDVAMTHFSLADLLSDEGRHQEALVHAERAWDRQQRDDVPPLYRAEAGFLVATLLWSTSESGEVRARALELAEGALEAFTELGPHAAEAAENARGWLAERRQ